MYRCLCEHGAGATPEYLVFAEVQRTQVLAFQRTWAALSFGVIVPLVSLLPFLCCFAARGLGRPRAPSTRSSDMVVPPNEEHASFAKLASAELHERWRSWSRRPMSPGEIGVVASNMACCMW